MSTITSENVFLDYPIIGIGSQSLKNRLLGAATGGLITPGDRIPVVNALRGVSFTFTEGDRVGLIGHNGAGKSTLLKVLAGIFRPTSGTVEKNGTVVSTLNIGLGMEPEATGIENIYIRGLLMGMARREIDKKLEDIIDFTELGKYLYMPVRIYSSGMATRLAFATITSIDADIILMDELIGTGDSAFIEKAGNRLNRFMSRSKILVLASHGEDIIRRFCNKAVLLEHGKLLGFGTTDEIFSMYHQRIAEN